MPRTESNCVLYQWINIVAEYEVQTHSKEYSRLLEHSGNANLHRPHISNIPGQMRQYREQHILLVAVKYSDQF